MADGYETVSQIVGDEMAKAWSGIIGKLADVATGKTVNTLEFSGKVLSQDAIIDFFERLGGTNLDVIFKRKSEPGVASVYRSFEVPLSTTSSATDDAKVLGVNGSISIGIGINF